MPRAVRPPGGDVGRAAGVRFFMPFDDFRKPHLPRDVETYREYRRRSIEFVRAKNRRIDDYSQRHLGG